MTQDKEEAWVPSVLFATVFTSEASLQECQFPETRVRGWRQADVPMVEEDQVREDFSKAGIYKPMGQEGMCVQKCWGSWQMSLQGYSQMVE